jgi:predicted PurR-regulated permease PerM
MTPNESNLERTSIFKPILILTAGVILLTVIHFAASFLLPIMMAAFFAVLLTPIFRWLKKMRVPAGFGATLVAFQDFPQVDPTQGRIIYPT